MEHENLSQEIRVQLPALTLIQLRFLWASIKEMNYVYLVGLPPRAAMGTWLDDKCRHAWKNVQGSPMSAVVTCTSLPPTPHPPSACLSAGFCPHVAAGWATDLLAGLLEETANHTPPPASLQPGSIEYPPRRHGPPASRLCVNQKGVTAHPPCHILRPCPWAAGAEPRLLWKTGGATEGSAGGHKCLGPMPSLSKGLDPCLPWQELENRAGCQGVMLRKGGDLRTKLEVVTLVIFGKERVSQARSTPSHRVDQRDWMQAFLPWNFLLQTSLWSRGKPPSASPSISRQIWVCACLERGLIWSDWL